MRESVECKQEGYMREGDPRKIFNICAEISRKTHGLVNLNVDWKNI